MTVITPARIDLTIYQGATYWQEWTWLDSNQDPIDLSNYIGRMQIREDVESATVLMEILSTGAADKKIYIGGKVAADPTLGIYGVWISAALTAAIDFESGVYDLELEDQNGFVRRIQEGKVKISPEVTRPQV